MSVFEAMEELAAAALIALAPGLEGGAPAGGAVEPGALIQRLRQRGAGDTIDDIVGDLTREVWAGAETRSLPHEALEKAFRAISAIIIKHAPTAEALRRLMAEGPAEGRARRGAIDTFTRARSAGDVASAQLADDVTLFLLDRAIFQAIRAPERLTAAAPQIAALHAERTVMPGAQPPLATTANPIDAPSSGESQDRLERQRIRQRYELAEHAEARLLALIDGQTPPPGQRLARLEALAQWLQEARAQLMRPTNEDGELRRLKTRAAQALGEGDLAVAMDTLKLVRRELRDGRRRIEARLEDEVAALKAQMLEEARAIARLGELALARRDHQAAAELFFEAADCLPKSGRDEAWRYHLARADALISRAEDTGDGHALAEALAAYSGVLKLVADGSNARGAALANLGLGRALLRLSANPGQGERIDDAVAALRKATALLSADEDARLWSLAHAALGGALADAARLSGDVGQLRLSVEALRIARASMPEDAPIADRLASETDLGARLLELSEHDKAPALLEEAVSVLSAALSRIDRATEPGNWTATAIKQASAELGLGEVRRDAKILDKAIGGLEAALSGIDQKTMRDDWIGASMTLADALAARAALDEGDASRVKAAAAAYRRVMETIDRGAAPMDWATVSLNLGTTLIRLGEFEDKRSNWLAAASAMMPALEVFETHGAKAHADIARRNLKRFHDQWDGLMGPASTAPTAPARLSQVG